MTEHLGNCSSTVYQETDGVSCQLQISLTHPALGYLDSGFPTDYQWLLEVPALSPTERSIALLLSNNGRNTTFKEEHLASWQYYTKNANMLIAKFHFQNTQTLRWQLPFFTFLTRENTPLLSYAMHPMSLRLQRVLFLRQWTTSQVIVQHSHGLYQGRSDAWNKSMDTRPRGWIQVISLCFSKSL